MKLSGVEKRDGWLYSEWRLTYRVGWEHICKAASLIFEFTDKPEIITGDAYEESERAVSEPREILSLDEAGYLTVRGTSEIMRVPLMITFYSQLDLVKVWVACATEEFAEADYRNFNLSMCQFMDSAEIAMYR